MSELYRKTFLQICFFSCAATQHVIMFLFFVFCFLSHRNYGLDLKNLSQTRPNLTKCDHTKLIQANLNQTKQDHTNLTEIQASPLLSVRPILSIYKLTFPNRTHKLDQTKITTNGFVMAKRAAQLLYVPLPVVSSVSVDLGTKTQMDFLMNLWFLYL